VTVYRDLTELYKEHRELMVAHRDLLERHTIVLQELAEVRQSREPVKFASGPLHMSEREEDIKHLREQGLVDDAEMRDLLAQAAFDNTEIEVQ
jgi:lipid II:glycine glycyltransferase (peptidoglycan interpeptide bridge formation enzyme)